MKRKFNYRTTVHINGTNIKLGFRGKLPEDFHREKVRVQAIFMQRQVERRFPMEAYLEEEDTGTYVHADADIELPYVFMNTPRHKVNVTYAVWLGMEEVILDDQPFPVQKELFERNDKKNHRNIVKFALATLALPVVVGRDYLREKNKQAALKTANGQVYEFSGYNYSPRQRKTDYFAIEYDKFTRKMKVKNNNILFLSERLPEEGGNLQRVKEWFKKDKSMVVSEFIVDKPVAELSKKELRKCAHLCARAHIIVLEDFYPQLHALTIRKETKVVQLWHACGAFKTFGLTRMGKPGGAPQSSMNHRNYDMVTVSSEAIRGIYAEAFGISTAKVKALGVPRTDVLFDEIYKEERRKAIYEKYPQLSGKKVVLFAPTFRGDGNIDAYYPRDAFDVNEFMDRMDQDTFCIVKHHPFVKEEIIVDEKYRDRVLDLTGKDHINDLMLVSDLLITDYSSSVFEAAILNLPMLFYAFDKDQYIASRDFYCDYDSFAPGYVESDFENMIKQAKAILNGDQDENNLWMEEKKARFFHDFLSALDGHSTERVAAYIKEKM